MTLKESIDRLSTDAENFMVHGTATNQRPYLVPRFVLMTNVEIVRLPRVALACHELPPGLPRSLLI
jgi:hypothetical protein